MTSSGTTRAEPAPMAPAPPVLRWWLLIAMCTAQLMVILDATIVNIALPDAQADLGFDAADRAWVVTAYALVFGSLLLIGGRVADRIGRRRAVLIGLAGFGLASALGGAAPSFEVLVTARALQGLFSALLAPAALAVITTTFTDERERGRAFGIFGAVSAAGGAAGLLLGGVLTQYASWRWTLYVNAVLAAAGIVLTLATLAQAEREQRAPGRRPDVAGTVAITVGLFALVFGFVNAYESGWSDALTLVCLVGGAVLIAAFLLIESRAPHPVLPLRVLASRVRGAALLVLFLGNVGLFAVTLLLTYYLQENLGFSPLQAGFAFLPQTLGAVGAALASGALLRRFPGRVLIPAGMGMVACGMFLLGRIETFDGYTTVILPGVLLIGAGLGLALSVAVNLGVQGVRDEDAGVASATVNAVQQVGGAVGPALFNTIAGSVLVSYVAARASSEQVLAAAAVRSYSVSFDVAAALLLGAVIISAAMLNLRPRRTTRPEHRVDARDVPAGTTR